MTSLASIGQTQPDRTRVFLGLGLFTSGCFLAALGTVGVIQRLVIAVGGSPSLAFTGGVLIGSLIVPVSVITLLRWLPTSDLTIQITHIGIGLIGLAIAGFLIASPPDLAPTLATTIILASYFLGLSVLLGALLGTVARESLSGRPTASLTGRPGSRSRGGRSGSHHRSTTRSRRSLPTDGGQEDDDLSFPLDDERSE